MDLTGYEPPIVTIGTNYLYELPTQNVTPTQSRFFLTTRSIHATHVWEAIEVESRERPERLANAKPAILKDVLINSSRLTEGDIQAQLFNDIREFAANSDWRKHALLSKFEEVAKDRLAALFDGDKFEDLFLRVALEHRYPETKCSKTDETKLKARVVTVFEEVCTALHHLPTLGEAIDVITQCTVALQLMMLAGWVHHDISAGNILAFREREPMPWKVKLADLEYAQKCVFKVKDVHSKIGTAYFIPFDIQDQKRLVWYKFRGDILVYDFQHDIESIWWLWLWLITMRISGNDASHGVYRAVFKNVAYIGDENRAGAWVGWLKPEAYVCQDLKDMAVVVDELRAKLLKLSSTYEGTSIEANYERYSDAHMAVRQALDIVDATKHIWGPLRLVEREKADVVADRKNDGPLDVMGDSDRPSRTSSSSERSADKPRPSNPAAIQANLVEPQMLDNTNRASQRSRTKRNAPEEPIDDIPVARMTRSRTKGTNEGMQARATNTTKSTRKSARKTPVDNSNKRIRLG
ncbi:hypothetical protein DFP72DRAFT_70348 [Ephemerocybe angulata]|uniref:Fungal-type protein kinase domain-containing protein n=1 Tax=Ephemerocybe angulata TaxID=980116 RepID=A0A8H6HDZ7_9AGAR|nr:hypothetical protein DFP72DRAFT_70348 [Tulosesus angulatus]